MQPRKEHLPTDVAKAAGKDGLKMEALVGKMGSPAGSDRSWLWHDASFYICSFQIQKR